MAELNASAYQEIANNFSYAQRQVVNVADYYYVAAREILESNDFQPELDLLKPFFNAYLAASTAYTEAPTSAVEAVRSLQRHILEHARDGSGEVYSDINDWMNDNSVTVNSEFAEMSERAGFPIDAGNIA